MRAPLLDAKMATEATIVQSQRDKEDPKAEKQLNDEPMREYKLQSGGPLPVIPKVLGIHHGAKPSSHVGVEGGVPGAIVITKRA
jgi:hypothetical protein